MSKEAIALQQSIVKKEKQSLALLKMLPRSLAIQRLIPTAFDHGSVKSYWTGKLQTSFEARKHGQPKPIKFTIITGNGEQFTFTPEQVPQELHPL